MKNLFTRLTLTVFLLLGGGVTNMAQTTLAVGDIAIVMLNNNKSCCLRHNN